MCNITEELRLIKEESKLRGYSRKTIKAYKYNIKKFLTIINKSPDNIDKDDVRNYLIKLIDQNYERSTIRLTMASIKFYFNQIKGKKIELSTISIPKMKRKLTVDRKVN